MDGEWVHDEFGVERGGFRKEGISNLSTLIGKVPLSVFMERSILCFPHRNNADGLSIARDLQC